MNYTHSITTKGQITIPKEIREKLGLDKTRRATFSLNKQGEVTISAPKTIEEIRAMLRVPAGSDASDKEKLIGKYLAKKYGVN